MTDILKMDKLMSQREVKQAQVLELLKEDKISQQEASKRLGITTRQVRRLTKRYQTAGLVSKKRGRASNRRLDEAIRAQVIDLIGARTTGMSCRHWLAKNLPSCMALSSLSRVRAR
ncbi:hypothetical protein W01_08950 [Candidatus Nitrotoga sp. AM1P]|nr:hypothetical protein W01_08950 [Candidatus Nitrotoga sp. AM1P]